MRRARVPHLVILLATALALPLGLGVSPAAAHKHPGAPVVAEPAVVYVETSVLTKINVTERGFGGTVTTPYQRSFPLGRGSGFVVNPDGTIVTVSRAVGGGVGGADIDAAADAFQEGYRDLKIPKEFVQTGFKAVLESPDSPRRGCFDTDPTHSACVDFARPAFRVFPYVAGSGAGLKATVVHAGKAGGEVAVLKVDSKEGMPSANLASSSATAVPFTVLGFTRPVAGQDRPQKVAGHFKNAPGARTIDSDPKQTNVNDLLAKLGGGLAGGPLVNDEGRVIGLASKTPDGQLDIRFVEAIREELKASGVEPAQGPVDTAFAEAKGYFDARHYSPAVTRLQDVLRLYPQHALARQLLGTAVAKAGGPEDLHPRNMGTESAGGSERGLLFWVAVAAGVLLLAGLALAVAFRGRFRRPAPREAPAVAGRPASAAPRGVVKVGPAPPGGPQPGSRRQEPPGDGVVTGASVGAGSRGQMQVRTAKDLTGSRPSFCTQCGKPLAVGHRFCGFCGTRVSS
ncbi:MAG TPA: trypsin-like peptidase domain-containing protein [Actinomycetes bacterium]|jgi:hypothetical protein|nr:trypsin-like peptidase domain-containing protein [Actinomycetes bacterium]